MPIYKLPTEEIWFPDPSEFEGDIVAVGGDLSPIRLLGAYACGIFPWYNEPQEIVWWCPEDRCILFLDDLKVSKSMKNVLNQRQFKVTIDKDFRGVIDGCRAGLRAKNTWLIDEMADAYNELHKLGYAHSVEVWHQKELVGGLYGVALGHVFYGESMFSTKSNASKVGFIALVAFLKKRGWIFIDCQVYNEHLGSLGATTISRDGFLDMLQSELKYETVLGKWDLDAP